MNFGREIPQRFLEGPFLGKDAVLAGVSRRRLRGRRFRRLHHDVYVAAGQEGLLETRLAAALLAVGDGAVFSCVTAARIYGIPVPERDRAVHVAIPKAADTVPRWRGLEVHQFDVPADQRTSHHGWPVVGPERLFLELAARLPQRDLIVAGDQLLRHALTTEPALAAFLFRSTGLRGVARARLALPLLSPLADSPPETHLRLLLLEAGLPAPAVNEPVRDPKMPWLILARPDLSYPHAKVAIEYEGTHHQQDRAQYLHDIHRDEALTTLGWQVIRITKEQLYRHPTTVITRITKALSRPTHQQAA
ncbi:endonuclease domain-containing protein [Actinocorallia lasiicapitis]